MAVLQQFLLSSWIAIALMFCFNHSVIAASSPNISDVFHNGIHNLHQQNYQSALVDFTQVIESQDKLVGAAYSNRCLANLQLQNNTAAQADCLLAIKYNSHNLEAYLNLGLAYYRQGKYQQAIAQYLEIVQQDQQDYRVYYNRGLAYSALADYQQAIADYHLALIYSPESNPESKSLIYNDLALAYIMLEEDEQAIFNFTQAIALDGNNYNAYYNRGCAYHRQKYYSVAIQDFDQAIQLNSNFTQAYVHRGILNHQIGIRDTALKDLNLALEQYQHQGNQEQYKTILNLKQQLFYTQQNQIV
ncbi:MAG: tetratricopeptide repeat protein [Pleurocapsa sp.]